MLSPEIWDFKPPQHHYFLEKRNCNKNGVPSAVSTHYFNHSISLVFPNTADVPDELRSSIVEDTDYYRINDVHVSELLNREFIEAFIKKGDLTLITVGKKIDLNNVIAITPTGHLILSVLTEDYQKLGLEGSPSFFDRQVHNRNVVTIDLKSDSFVPGKKNYERTRTSLTERFEETFDVIIAWNPPDEHICPSSIAAWFHGRGYSVNLCRQTFSNRTEHSLKIPIISENTKIEKFFEWLGVLSISGDLNNVKVDDYVNTFVCPLPCETVSQVQYMQSVGLFTSSQISRLYKLLNEYVQSQDTLPWIALHVQGFTDSPVSWHLKEHGFFVDGDNSYTVIFRPHSDIIIRKSLSSNNKPRLY